jgi:molecular chaperone DnaJ
MIVIVEEPMAKSYFAILGISSSASPEEVRAAYRRLAKEFHPDHFEGGSKPFREIQEAYSVLGNARKRDRYERSLESARMLRPRRQPSGIEPEPLIPEQRPVKFGEISPIKSFHTYTPSHDEIFDWLWHNFSNIAWPKSGRVQELTLEVLLTRDQALRGGNAKVMVPARALCPACEGAGGVDYYECSRCGGEGAISGEIPISISFPAGLTSDHAVMVPLDRFGIKNLHLTVLFRIVDDS